MLSLFSLASAIDCEASSFASGVTVEPFSSTIVNSEIFYQCHPGLLQEGRGTLRCGEDGRWNPDPQGLCIGNRLAKSYFAYYSIVLSFLILISIPDKSLPTAVTTAITAVVCLLVAFITGALFGALVTVCISRWNTKGHRSKPAPNTEEQQQAAAVYEEVDTQSKKIELKENVAYGPVKQDQTFELKENVAYGPVKSLDTQ